MEGKSALEQKILQKARAQAQEILQKEQAAAGVVRDGLRRQAEGELAEAMSQAKRRAEMIRKEYEASGHLEARLLLLKKKEELINKVIGQAWEQLKVAVKRCDYRDVASRLVQEAIASLGLSQAIVALGAEEKKLFGNDAAALAKQVGLLLGKTVRLEFSGETLNSLGGVRVTDLQRHLLYDNTWDARLERLRSQMALEISEILFSGEEEKQGHKAGTKEPLRA